LHICEKIPDVSNLKRGIIYFDSHFQWFQSIVLGSIYSGHRVRQNIIMQKHVAKATHLLASWEAQSKKETQNKIQTPRTCPNAPLPPARPIDS
jgi:hypothetical protein